MGSADDPAKTDAAGDAAALLSVSVVFSPRAGEVDSVDMMLPAGATVADALDRSDLQRRHPGIDLSALPVGIWGSFCARTDRLRDRDRVELYRPLKVDPKEARRLRVQQQRGLARKSVKLPR